MYTQGVKQPFDMVSDPTRGINLRSYRVRNQGSCPPILNLLIIGSSIGLFAYVNTYFVVKMANVINGSVFTQPTPTFSCDTYFCDQTAYNFIYYYSNYLKCNTLNCQNIICASYDCNNTANYDINYYYACQPKCGPMKDTPTPPYVQTAYIMSIITACFFGVGVLIAILYGIIAAMCSSGLTCLERIGLLLTFVWPKLKYYEFRKRQNWQDFYFDFKAMVIIDIVINICYAVTLSLYIYLQISGFWQTSPEIANFYMLIWAYIVRISMVGEVSGPFCKASREIQEMRVNAYI